MVRLTFTTTSPRAIDRLKEKAPIAIARALNKSIASAKTVMVRVIGQDMGLKAVDVRDRIGLRPATANHHVATLYAHASRIPLIDFNAKSTKSGVIYRIGSGGRQRISNAFIARVKGPLPSGVVSPGHTGVFVRRGKTRLPIDQLFGPSIWGVFKKNEAVGIARGQEQLEKNLKSEFRFALELEQ